MTDKTRKDPLDLSSEEELFALLADNVSSDEHDNPSGDRLHTLLQDRFDWSDFLRLTSHHNYLAAAYRFFRDIGTFDDMPEHVKSVLEQEYLLGQARFAKKESELMEILEAFKARNLDAVVFKGIPKAYLLYNDPGIRVSKDIDILVDPDMLEEAQQVLLENGYALYSGLLTEEDYRAHHFHLIYTRGENKDIVIELHWTLLDPKKGHVMDCEAVLQHAVPIMIQGRDVKTLGIPHSLWYECMHLSYKAYLDVRGLAELKRLAMKLDESDWEEAIQWARKSETLDQVKYALAVAEAFFGEFLEDGISRRLKVSRFVDMFIISMYYPRGLVWEWVPFVDTHEIVVSLSLRRGIRKKISFLYNLVFPDKTTFYEVYPKRTSEAGDSGRRFYPRGIYVFFKVTMLTLFMGLLIRTRILGERKLDPSRDEAVFPV